MFLFRRWADLEPALPTRFCNDPPKQFNLPSVASFYFNYQLSDHQGFACFLIPLKFVSLFSPIFVQPIATIMSLLTCHWNKLIFANYIVPPEILEKHLPTHTQLDYFNGQCYVSLVGFQFRKVEIADVKVPFHTDFEEINLRCYVKRLDGQTWRKGTVFLGEIVDKPALAILANSLFRENYKVLP